ncbi:nitronate monooxygenase [Tessaracoccus antarcticus]|uniref:Nitronate monooxygenase n=2 Tax=Tessaracoccus antarcticus TaxID=2479848 RepID=A0A3M0GYV1_9ACTN|nr:nitronate monooxygenase [Tessaracoccus antarcticus]
MGIAVSAWQLAREVSLCGQLGVVSGTALDGVLARVLQDGDQGGHRRRALSHFPSPDMAQRVLDRYFLEGGRPPGQPYRPHPTLTIAPARDAIELSLLGNFSEVWLAKEGHAGEVGINMLEKVQTANTSAILGAMIADVDYVIMGAGVPREIPRLLTDFAAGHTGHLTIDVAGSATVHRASLDPVDHLGPDLPALRRPHFLAIVSLHVLADYLNRDPEIRPDGFIVEGPRAGGHSSPPRGRLVLDDIGEPVYGSRDEADLTRVAAVGLPFWLAGGYATPEKVAQALAAGAAGVQTGTLFAMAEESGLTPTLRKTLVSQLADGSLVVRNDPRASPTGFPFKVAELQPTQEDAKPRERICDLGYLRVPVERADKTVAYRCPSEPTHMYIRKGGSLEDTVGRQCLCNALMANVGLGQLRRGGYEEEPAVTLGQDLAGAEQLQSLHPGGWTARQAVDWLLPA